MKKISFMFDYGRDFKACVVFKDEEEANRFAGASLQSWINDFKRWKKNETNISAPGSEDPEEVAERDFQKSLNTMKYLLSINNITGKKADSILKQITPKTLNREYEWYGLITTIEVDDEIGDAIIKDMNNIRELVENKKVSINNVFEKYSNIKNKQSKNKKRS